ncbi:hypothetical protein [Limnofasciculus baicalensis]|uniref:Uncharacterized protein n=1 Tax=Limnofasciculus baicalensis BBK-W-15 TaxID=2699891 RepID=A0AAE3KSL2_9CYAN|nr:hypothetical protein [Limnofasciculus baicalensis]MCP2729572.1 hypothetical protein [Limnofasciculus baicalensis BBK-W-15]
MNFNESGRYRLQTPDQNGRFAIASLGLFLGVWQGTRDSRTGYWLRWWDEAGNLLLWALELAQEQRQRAEEAESQLETLRQRLRSAGIE